MYYLNFVLESVACENDNQERKRYANLEIATQVEDNESSSNQEVAFLYSHKWLEECIEWKQSYTKTLLKVHRVIHKANKTSCFILPQLDWKLQTKVDANSKPTQIGTNNHWWSLEAEFLGIKL